MYFSLIVFLFLITTYLMICPDMKQWLIMELNHV